MLIKHANARALALVAPVSCALQTPVDVIIGLQGDILEAHFTVRSPNIFAREKLGPGEFPYQFDVVELFISFNRSHLPYFEFEVSPYNESFVVKVDSPRKQFIENFATGFSHSVKQISGGWQATMRIPLKPLGWNGDPNTIVGNAFAILGQEPRTYWSLYLPPQEVADFHLPQFFRPIL